MTPMNLPLIVALSRSRSLVATGILASLSLALPAFAGAITLTNPSFELPSTTDVIPVLDGWDRTPQPAWFDPALTGGITWDQLSGTFANTAVGLPNHIDNLDGSQAAYMIALGAAGFGQVGPATYQDGMRYDLSVGVLGGGGIPEGTTLLVGFFYVDGTGNAVTIGGKTVTYTAAEFPNSTHLVNQQATLTLAAGDPAIGKNIGVGFVATSGAGVGYWDLDNVQLTSTAVPEPGTWALLGLGLGGLVAATRRGKSRQ